MISMSDAASDLERLCDDLENLPGLSIQVQELFAEKQDILAEAVDKRIRYMEYLKSQIDHTEHMVDKWNKRYSHLVQILDAIKSEALFLAKSSSVPLKGSLGKFKVVKNSRPTLQITDENHEDLANYKKVIVKTAIDKDALKDDILAGKEITGVSLVFGEHLRY